MRALFEHRPLVLEVEELRERRVLPLLLEAAPAADHIREEEAALARQLRDRAQQNVDLRWLEVHRAVEEAEAVVRDCSLIRGRGGVVGGGVEDGVVRRDAAQRERRVAVLDDRLVLAHVHDAPDRLGFRE